ncbi:MAG: hypothetical protein IKA64_04850 [Clostridia bacterium]|nr:hypothetical protein [Clostridia bacterium]
MQREQIRDFRISYSSHTGLTAAAPFTLYSTLRRHAIIGDAPLSKSEREALSDGSMEITADFVLDSLFIGKKHKYIFIDGLTAPARIVLNGTALAETAGERSLRLDASGVLTAGTNVITFTLDASADAGIVGGVSLVGFDCAAIDGVSLSQKNEDGRSTLSVRVSTLGNADGARAVATLVAPGAQIYYAGLIGGEGDIIVPGPNLWWPSELGIQNLYRLTVNLYCGGEIEDTREMSVGFRSVSRCGECATAVNGTSLYLYGAALVSSDAELPTLASGYERELLGIASSAGFNTVRIPHGVYPREELLSAADELGILVFCEADFDTDPARRAWICDMAHHPSFAAVLSESEGTLSECRRSLPDVLLLPSDDCIPIDFPALADESLIRLVADTENIDVFSPAAEACEAVPGDGERIVGAAAKKYRYSYSYSDLAYVSGLLLTEELMSTVRTLRCEGGAGGILLRRLNDTAVATSPALVDCHTRGRALAYTAGRILAPVAVIPSFDGGRATLLVSNERQWGFIGQLRYRVCDNKNEVILEGESTVGVPSGDVLSVSPDVSDAILGHEHEYYLEYRLLEGGAETAEGTLLFTNPKSFDFLDPDVRLDIEGSGTSFTLSVNSSAYARSVELSLNEPEGVFSENYFDLTGSPRRITLTTAAASTVAKLKRKIRVRSVYSVGK